MREQVTEVYGHLRGAWKYRWYMLVISWMICIVGWLYVAKMPDQYQASAKVYVDTSSVLQPLLRGLASGSVSSAAQTDMITRTLLTRPNIEKLIQMVDLDKTVYSDEQMNALVSSIQSRLKLNSDRRKRNLYAISYTDESPDQAKKVVQALLTIFVESSLGESRRGEDVAQVFLDQQIAEYEQKLSESESRLRDFKQMNVGMMPNDGGGYYSRLQVAQDQLEGSKLEFGEAEKRRKKAEEQLKSSRESLESSDVAKVVKTSVDDRIKVIEQQLDLMLLTYTSAHPNVLAAKGVLEELEAQRAAEIEAFKHPDSTEKSRNASVGASPVYQQLQLTLADAEIASASLRERVRQHQSRVNRLAEMVNTIPEIEAEFKKLNRNYGIYKKNYDQLVAKRESTQISEDASRSEDGVSFKVVEPPYAPANPVGPKRNFFALVVLLAGLAVGSVFAYLMTQLRPTFESHRDLIEATRCPVLGYVSKVQSRSEVIKKRAEISLFVGALGILILAFGLIQLMGVKI